MFSKKLHGLILSWLFWGNIFVSFRFLCKNHWHSRIFGTKKLLTKPSNFINMLIKGDKNAIKIKSLVSEHTFFKLYIFFIVQYFERNFALNTNFPDYLLNVFTKIIFFYLIVIFTRTYLILPISVTHGCS